MAALRDIPGEEKQGGLGGGVPAAGSGEADGRPQRGVGLRGPEAERERHAGCDGPVHGPGLPGPVVLPEALHPDRGPSLKDPIPKLTPIFQPNDPTLESSFSPASKPIFAPKYARFSIFRELQDCHTFAPLPFAKNVLDIVQKFANFADFFVELHYFVPKIIVFNANFNENFSEFQHVVHA